MKLDSATADLTAPAKLTEGRNAFGVEDDRHERAARGVAGAHDPDPTGVRGPRE